MGLSCAEMDAPAQSRLYLTVLFIRQGRFYIAQALEHDISAQGSTIRRAKHAFEQAFIGRVLLDRRMKREPLSNTPRAPERFWELFRRIVARHGALTTEPVETFDDVPEMPPAFMVQAFADSADANHSA